MTTRHPDPPPGASARPPPQRAKPIPNTDIERITTLARRQQRPRRRITHPCIRVKTNSAADVLLPEARPVWRRTSFTLSEVEALLRVGIRKTGGRRCG
jgi:hypothetical protein